MYSARLTPSWCLHLLEQMDDALAEGCLGFPMVSLPPQEDCDVRAKALGAVLDGLNLGPVTVGLSHTSTPAQLSSKCSVPHLGDVLVTPTGAMVVFDATTSAHAALQARAKIAAGLARLRADGVRA